MNTQKTLTIALATLGLFGVAGAAFLANGGAASKSEPLIIRDLSRGAANTLISDVPTDEPAVDGGECGELFAEQQAGPRGGGGEIGGQPGGQRGPGGQGGPGGPQGMMRGGGPQGPMILRDPKVQQELKLTENQIAQIQQALEELRPQGGRGGGEGRPGGQGGGQGRGGQQGGQGGQGGVGGGQGQPGQGGPGGPPQGRMNEQMQAFEQKLQTILNSGQFSRYQQLSLQSAGPNAFNRPDVVEKLGITEQQRQQMREIMEANRPQPPQPPQGGQGQGEPPAPPRPEEMKAKQEALMNQLLGVLTAQQRSTWQSMIGAKFEFTMGQAPRPGGRGGGGGGRLGGGGGNGGGGGTLEDASIVF